MRGLCHHYRVELHNFAPNSISQAAFLVIVCEGFFGIPMHWDLWVNTLVARHTQGAVPTVHHDIEQR
jgi:hypothetical protein